MWVVVLENGTNESCPSCHGPFEDKSLAVERMKNLVKEAEDELKDNYAVSGWYVKEGTGPDAVWLVIEDDEQDVLVRVFVKELQK